MTSNFIFDTKEEYCKMIDAWKENFKNARPLKRTEHGNKIQKLTHIDFFLYAILRGKDPRKGYHCDQKFDGACAEIDDRISSDLFRERYLERWSKLYGDAIDTNHLLRAWNKFLDNMEAA
jgi:hypothetical protein